MSSVLDLGRISLLVVIGAFVNYLVSFILQQFNLLKDKKDITLEIVTDEITKVQIDFKANTNEFEEKINQILSDLRKGGDF